MMTRFRFLKYLKVQVSLYFLTASLLIIAILGSIMYFSISNVILQDELASTRDSVDRSGRYVELYIDKVKALSSMIAKDRVITGYLEGNDGIQRVSVMDRIEDVLSTDEFLVSVIIVGKDGAVISNEKELDMTVSDDMMEQDWYKDVVYGDGMPVLTSIRMQEFSMDKDSWVLSISREIVDENGENLGVLLMDIGYRVIEDYLQGLDLGREGYAYILNDNYEVVYHPDTLYFTDDEKIGKLVDILKMQDGYDSNMGILTHHYSIEGSDWILTGISTLDNLSMIQRQILETFAIAGLILFAITMGSGIFIAGRITDPIKELEKAMINIDENLDAEVDEKGCYESINLAKHFNEMTLKIRDLMDDISSKEKYLRTYEINALYSQINPHFLYNTLDTIIWMAEFGESEKVIDITKSLASFFRLSLSKGDEMISLEDELNHAREYLFIQKQRYEDRLEYEFSVDEELLQMMVPKIILQPLVENAIYHGIRELEKGGKITISAKKVKNTVELLIKDDGKGFSVDKIEKSDIKLGGIGIRNVDERIKLYYGNDYGVEISSEEGKGTEALIRIPLLHLP
ncbi:two-component system, sensor histidine kinase YesM [Dethiosulfatibacter aminovorans DSM 17477]|uniref:histidine kinase n=1 Tax=Dethiosulfatibacter aminovorans DSM 17477 TaxID=1121476 RepID=A0A1M6A901_9FIRM|nr:sensor histidine kinase [Dethiosulfatibacter aminovorans]SHI32940.1 two-component system, sensor histidine kinase YesM [Dethiosulfatibacter aminovorans DSM 17477]